MELKSKSKRHKAGASFPIWFPCCFENQAANYRARELFSTVPFPRSNGRGIAQKSAFCPVNISQGKLFEEMDPGELECDCFFSLEIPMGLGITCCLQSPWSFSLPGGILWVFSSLLSAEAERKGSLSLQREDGLLIRHGREAGTKGGPVHSSCDSQEHQGRKLSDFLTFTS